MTYFRNSGIRGHSTLQGNITNLTNYTLNISLIITFFFLESGGSASGEVWKRCIFPEFYPNSTRYPILSLLMKAGTSTEDCLRLVYIYKCSSAWTIEYN